MADDASNNPYIRTYAKDVAQLTGKDPSVLKNEPVSLPRAAPAAPTPEASADADREEVLARLRERAAKDPVHEGNLLPNSLPTPVPKAEPVAESAFRAPAPPVVEKPVAPPMHDSVPMMPSAPIQPVAHSMPEAPPPPTFIPPKEGPPPVSLDNVSPLHTYASDFSDRIDTKGASAFSVLAAESDAGTAGPSAPVARKSHRGLYITIASVLLIFIGGGGAYAAYWYVSQHATVPVVPPAPSLVFADDRKALTGEGPQLIEALANESNDPLPEGEVRVVYLTEATTTTKGTPETIPLSGGDLIGALQLTAPDVLLRNIAPESTVGVVHAGNETRPFFILRVLSYESTFAGMLAWESTMQMSLAPFYPSYPAPAPLPPTIATTTTIVHGKKMVATTTVPAIQLPVAAPAFVDEIASNHNVRALKDGEGRTIFLYGYFDKQTLVITRDEAAFAEIVNRLSATKQQ